MLDRKNFYIDGKWVSPIEPRNHKDIHPSNEEISSEISLGGKQEVDKAVEKSEPGMLFHNFDSDPLNELKFTWTEIYKNDDALIFHINNPPVGELSLIHI